MQTNDELRALLASHRLSRETVAGLLFVSRHSVDGWLKTPGGPSYRTMPRSTLELLRLKLASYQDAEDRPG